MYPFFAKCIPVLLFIGDYISFCHTRWYSNDKHEKSTQLSTVSHKHYCFLFSFPPFFSFSFCHSNSQTQLIWNDNAILMRFGQVNPQWNSSYGDLSFQWLTGIFVVERKWWCTETWKTWCLQWLLSYWHETYIFGNSFTVLWWNNTFSFLFSTERMEQHL